METALTSGDPDRLDAASRTLTSPGFERHLHVDELIRRKLLAQDG